MNELQADFEDRRLLSYVVASGDMRHIPINERELYLRDIPDRGLLVQGEIPGCGPDCNINLSQVLFEYAVSCEDCKDHIASAEMELRFGQHLGQVLATEVKLKLAELTARSQLEKLMAIVLSSMDAPYSAEGDGNYLRYELHDCPIQRAANEPGYSLRLPAVHLGFAALCEAIVNGLAPSWQLVKPLVEESELPLGEVHFARR
jgi:hypothetical protein